MSRLRSQLLSSFATTRARLRFGQIEKRYCETRRTVGGGTEPRLGIRTTGIHSVVFPLFSRICILYLASGAFCSVVYRERGGELFPFLADKARNARETRRNQGGKKLDKGFRETHIHEEEEGERGFAMDFGSWRSNDSVENASLPSRTP